MTKVTESSELLDGQKDAVVFYGIVPAIFALLALMDFANRLEEIPTNLKVDYESSLYLTYASDIEDLHPGSYRAVLNALFDYNVSMKD